MHYNVTPLCISKKATILQYYTSYSMAKKVFPICFQSFYVHKYLYPVRTFLGPLQGHSGPFPVPSQTLSWPHQAPTIDQAPTAPSPSALHVKITTNANNK
jgi:hypothetical protein